MLILFQRHGYAGERLPDKTEDDARELLNEGVKQLQAMGTYVDKQAYGIDRIFASPIVRAQQTAAIMAKLLFDDEDAFTTDPNLAPYKPMEMAFVMRTQDDTFSRPLLIGHHDNLPRLFNLLGDFNPGPDPIAMGEVRVFKVKRKNVEVGGGMSGPTAKWKEKARYLPSDVDGGNFLDYY